jgi:hypothetical protein
MALKRTLDAYLESTRSIALLGPGEPATDVSAAEDKLTADLERARGSYRVWTAATVLVTLALTFAAVLTHGKQEIGSLLSAGGVAVILFRIARHRFAADLVLAILKAAPPDPKERRRIVAAFQARL